MAPASFLARGASKRVNIVDRSKAAGGDDRN